MLRSIRIRAQENAIYTRNYNRMRFIISPDGMSTDLSQSYLAFKLNVVNGKTNEPYTNDEIKNLVNNKIMFAFADSVGEAYSPACMIKTARLFYKGQPIEEIQYSNCLSQTLKQFQSDFETLASESIMSMNNTGMLLNGSLAASTSSYFGASQSLSDQAVQVNIPLKDLFGVCRSNNFWIDSEVLIELELEDTKNLIQQSCVADLTSPLPERVDITPPVGPTGGTGATGTFGTSYNTGYTAGPTGTFVPGFTPTNPTNHLANLCPTQNLFSATSRSMASLYNQNEKKIETPQCYRFGSEYIGQFFPPSSNTPVATTALVADTYYRIINLGTLTLANWNTAGWLNQKVLPVLGDFFKAKAPVASTDGSCIVVNSKNEVVGTPGSSSNTIILSPKYPWTATNLNELQLKYGSILKFVFKISQSGHVDRLFEFYSEISVATPFTSGTSPASLQVINLFAYPIFDGELTGATVSLDSFELIPNSELTQIDAAQYQGLIDTNILTGVPDAYVKNLQQGGVLSGGTLAQVGVTINHLTGANVFFNAALSINSVVTGQFTGQNVVCIYPDLYESADIPSMRRLYSNQGKKLPTQQGLLRIVKATKNATNPTTEWDLHFHTAGLENNNSLQNQTLQCNLNGATILPGFKKVPMYDAYLTVFNAKIQQTGKSASYMVPGEWYGIASVGSIPSGAPKTIDEYWQACGNTATPAAVGQSFLCREPMPESISGATVIWLQANRTHADYAAKTWEIPKAEVILVQRERDPQMPPSPVYSTFRCEAFTIENKLLTDFQRQFIVSERDCFNLLLVTPNYTADSDDKYPETLISKSHNINSYRWSINNIDDTNRAIVIKNNTSSAPSTLHLDKLMDTMKNDAGGLMSLSGINGVWRSVDPPVVFPLKIYTAIDAEMNYLSGLGGYTVQFSAVGDSTHDKYIQPGACFLFKQCFKTLP